MLEFWQHYANDALVGCDPLTYKTVKVKHKTGLVPFSTIFIAYFSALLLQTVAIMLL